MPMCAQTRPFAPEPMSSPFRQRIGGPAVGGRASGRSFGGPFALNNALTTELSVCIKPLVPGG